MRNKLRLNNVMTLIYQIVSVIVGIIVPRLILKQFGSNVNGLVSSITQLLSIISLMDLGVGAVVQSALYKPLLEEDNIKISKIFWSSQKYFSRIAKILLIYILILCVYYGVFKGNLFSWQYTTTLILSLSLSYFAQYYFGISNSLILSADQKVYVVTLINLTALIINTIITIILIYVGSSIQVVKLSSSCVFLFKPLILQYYVKRNYNIKKFDQITDSIPNKWSGLAQHITVVLTNSVDTVMLTLFGSFGLISIYNVYVLPLNSLRTLVETTSTGYKSFFGNLIAKNDSNKLIEEFSKYETMMHIIITVLMSTCLVVLIPFVKIYTNGIDDINYINLCFCICIVLAYTFQLLRVIYTNIIYASGKFKETQLICVIECILNLGISFFLVKPLGLVGVALGTVVASAYRLFSTAYYLQNNVLNRSLFILLKHLIINAICFFIVGILSSFIKPIGNSIFDLVIYAFIIFFMSLVVSLLMNMIFYINIIYKIFLQKIV
ncbi:lipopolysaccharide biosynthesis protein [Massilimicrobiota timonensis]|uniref:lipopolysaccharide biosynthesis protein n=1 Tax=Massilimicrobiota timonensis TaxID=1776392 RepID=UPI00195F49C0|nr:polysaccharide biosynthesis C-terminal domain-containing protein [Massilimicrobiota timonensis]MBM6966294.1 polysaccharide biosynthesis C-terminal domain-containing protein [Massilimicrobiota timonensis]